MNQTEKAKYNTPTRNKIVVAAMRLFYEQGYPAVTLYDIARDLNLKQAHVYYHFRHKREIGLEILKRWQQQFHDVLSQLSAEAQATAALHSFIQLTADMQSSYTQWGCPIASLTDSLIRESTDAAQVSEVPLIFHMQKEWLQNTLMHTGLTATQAEAQALDYLARRQGAIHLSYLFQSPDILEQFMVQAPTLLYG